MDSDLLIAAALIGFGFGNVFLCSFISLSSTVGRGLHVGAAFIAGRFLGIMALGLFIVFFGWYMDISSQWMLLVFAIASLAFGILVLVWPSGMAKLKLLKHCEVGGCQDCEHNDHSDDTGAHDCKSCSSTSCAMSSGGSDDVEENKKDNHSLFTQSNGMGTMSVGFLGFVRGATPCLKLLLLVPLILTLPLYESLAVTGVFAASSSIYSVMGIFGGYVLGMNFSERIPQLRKAGAVMLIVVGIYFVYKFWTFSCPGSI
jgi:MFS family permease